MSSADDFGILLHAAFAAFKDQLHQHLATKGFVDLGSAFGYVFRILETEPTNLRHLAEHLGMTPQGALKVINDMELKGYVQREDDPSDGRIKTLRLTARGRAAVAEARRFHRLFETTLTAEIGERGLRALRSSLARIAAGADGTHTRRLRPF